jgi:uncharacterized protein (DUF58 family)
MRQRQQAAHSPVRVYPDLKSVRAYDLLARQNREHSLTRTAKKLGGESEFERLREYSQDDEYRSIDWKATARRGRLIARQYQLESNQNVVFLLESGRLMTAEANGMALFDHALNATLMLAHVAIRNGDRVGLLSFSDAVSRFVAPQAGAGGNRALVQACYTLHPDLIEADFDAAFEYVGLHLRKRSLLVLFTQVLDDVTARTLLRRARAASRRHLLLLILLKDEDIDALMEEESGGTERLYVKAATAEFLRFRERVVRDLRASGVHVLEVAPTALTPTLVHNYLKIKAQHLL